MTKRSKNALFVLIISFLMSVLRFFLVVTNMEKNNPNTDTYYLPNNFVVIGFTVATVLLLAVFAFSAFSLSKKTAVVVDDGSCAVSVGALILGFVLVGAAITYFWTGSSESTAVAGPMAGMINPQQQKFAWIETAVIVFCILSAAVFVFRGLYNNQKKSLGNQISAVLALVPIFLTAFRLLNDFINSSAAPLASSGAYHMLGLVFSLLFFLSEGKSYSAQTSCVVFDVYGFFSIWFLLVYSIPNLVLRCFGSFSFNMDAAMSAVDLAVAVYIVTRLMSAKTVPLVKEKKK